MTELVRGSIADRPWGLTFSQFGLRGVTGQLTVRAVDGKEYRVAFDGGSIVGATSAQPADSAIRVALTANLITSSQVTNITRQIAARPGDDEIEVLAATCKLDIMQSLKLRRRVTVQRAARTFSIENGSFVLDDEITIPTAYDAAVDIRAVVYQGARLNLSETRLIGELRDLGSHFTLGESAPIAEFGIDPLALTIVDELRTGSSVAQIEARHRDLDPRTVQSVVYALVVCRDARVTAETKATPAVSVAFKPKSGEDPAPRVDSGKTDSGTQRRLVPIVEVDTRPRTPSGPQTMPRPIVEIDARPRSPTGAPVAAPVTELRSMQSGPHDAQAERERPPTGPRAIAELELEPEATEPQRTPTHPMPLDSRAPAPISPPEPPRTTTKKAGIELRPPAASQAPEPPDPPRTSTRRPEQPLRPPATPTAPEPPDAPRTSTHRPSAELRPPAPQASETASPIRVDEPAIIGLPGLEEEPTRSRNLVGSLDLGPPALPERTPTDAPVVGRVSSAFDFLDPRSAVIGNAPGPRPHEEPTLRSIDVARVAGRPPELPGQRKTPPSGVPTIPALPPLPSPGADRSRPATSPRLSSDTRSSRSASSDPSWFAAAEGPRSASSAPTGSPADASSETASSPTTSPSGSFAAADRARSPTSSPTGSSVDTSSDRARTSTSSPSGSFTAPRTRSSTGSPNPSTGSSGSDRPRSPTPGGASDRFRPPTSPPLRPKTPTASPAPRAKSSTVPPSDGAPGEVGFEPSESRRTLADATVAYQLGQQALRDGNVGAAVEHLTVAATLNPHEFDHAALLAWAQCLAASPAERSRAAEKARKMLTHATQKSSNPEQARFHLGQLEKLLGRDKDALVLFQAVLRSVPDHAGATAEIAALEAKSDKGLLGLFKKKT